MAGARGDALDWALALARAPGERMALRQRPLPDGIEPLLQIATGSRGEALQEAMGRSDESEADLVEAVRFYLREVLFHSGADAYRMLGVSREASAEQIKTHHRLLQQWLHPDRQTSDWDAIFAGRVNAAWNALRTPAHRAEYDKAHPVRSSAPELAGRSAPRVVAMPLGEGDTAEGGRWRRRAPVLALFAACAVLGVAAVRDALRTPESGYPSEPRQVAGAPAADAEAIALRVPAAKPRPVGKPKARPEIKSRPSDLREDPPAPPAAIAQPAEAIAAGSLPDSALRNARAPAHVDEPAPIDAPRPKPTQPPSPIARAAPAGDAVRVTSAAPVPVDAPARVAQATPAVAKLAPNQAASVANPVAPVAPAVPSTVASAERVLQAQRTGRELMAFLSSRSARVPPIWDSMAAQQRALGLRERLHERGQLRAGEPHWRVGNEEAALRTLYGEQAQVRAQFVWRDQRWLVSGVALEEAP